MTSAFRSLWRRHIVRRFIQATTQARLVGDCFPLVCSTTAAAAAGTCLRAPRGRHTEGRQCIISQLSAAAGAARRPTRQLVVRGTWQVPVLGEAAAAAATQSRRELIAEVLRLSVTLSRC